MILADTDKLQRERKHVGQLWTHLEEDLKFLERQTLVLPQGSMHYCVLHKADLQKLLLVHQASQKGVIQDFVVLFEDIESLVWRCIDEREEVEFVNLVRQLGSRSIGGDAAIDMAGLGILEQPEQLKQNITQLFQFIQRKRREMGKEQAPKIRLYARPHRECGAADLAWKTIPGYEMCATSDEVAEQFATQKLLPLFGEIIQEYDLDDTFESHELHTHQAVPVKPFYHQAVGAYVLYLDVSIDSLQTGLTNSAFVIKNLLRTSLYDITSMTGDNGRPDPERTAQLVALAYSISSNPAGKNPGAILGIDFPSQKQPFRILIEDPTANEEYFQAFVIEIQKLITPKQMKTVEFVRVKL